MIRKPQWNARRAVPWVVLLSAALFTAATASYAARTSHERNQVRFQNAVQSAQDRIARRLDVYLATLQSAAAMWTVMDTVTAAAFEAYVEGLDLQRRYPGIQGVGWSVRLPAGSGSEERHSIRYLEPLDDRNRAAIGYDMYSEATRRSAMSRARDSGEPALTGRLRLVQEIYGPEQAGFLLYVPVYRRGGTPATTEARRRALEGFVYSPFRADDLFEGIFGSESQPRVAIRVYDGHSTDAGDLLHASPGAFEEAPAFTATRTLTESGRPWTVVFSSTPAFESTSGSVVPWMVLLTGLAASVWLFVLARGLVRAGAKAEAANQAKSAFLATMSHELRTPLNAIAGYADLLVLEVAGPLAAAQREFVDRIIVAQGHLLGLINDVLNFAKLEAGRVEIRLQPMAVERAAAEATSLVSSQIAEKGLDYHARGGPPLVVLADPEKVRQILLNLLSNAIKFTAPGGYVAMQWAAVNGAAEITVSDSGVGIPADQLNAIFDPFVQVDADLTRTHHGTGLGLAISQELARDMDGDIRVESTRGVGSRFTLTLPIDPEAPAKVAGRATRSD